MTSKVKDDIKAFFETGDRPSESQFIDLIDSYVDKNGPVGTWETLTSANANGFAFASARQGKVVAAGQARTFLGMTVYTTALASSVAVDSVRNTFTTTAQASSISTDAARGLAGVAIGNLVQLEDVGGNPGLPAVDGSQITNAPGRIVLGTPTATTSGTSHQYTSIPSGTKRITISFSEVSTNGASAFEVQLGTTSGYETSGYLGFGALISGSGINSVNISTGFPSRILVAAALLSGQCVLTLLNSTTNTWSCVFTLGRSDSTTSGGSFVVGSKVLAAELDRVRINSTDTFDSGVINIMYEG
jgi:hypothetical protein